MSIFVSVHLQSKVFSHIVLDNSNFFLASVSLNNLTELPVAEIKNNMCISIWNNGR